MDEKEKEQLQSEMEREIAANEAADRAHRRRYIIAIITGAVIVIAVVAYFKLRPKAEPDIYYNGEHIGRLVVMCGSAWGGCVYFCLRGLVSQLCQLAM